MTKTERDLVTHQHDLETIRAKYETRRQLLFYVMFTVTMVTLGVATWLLLEVRGLVQDREAAAERQTKSTADAIAKVAAERRADTDAQTVAIEQFVLDLFSGKTPPPEPASVVFPSPTPRPRRAASPAPRPSPQPSNKPAPRPRPTPKPSPTCIVVPSPITVGPICRRS